MRARLLRLAVLVAAIYLTRFIPVPSGVRFETPSLYDRLFRAAPVEAFYRFSSIKSIQEGTCSVNGTGAGTIVTCTITLSPTLTSTSAALVTYNGSTNVWNAVNPTVLPACGVVLTNASTVTASCTDVSTGTPLATIRVTVTEWYPNLFTANGVQRGTITVANNSNTGTGSVTGVGSKAAVYGSGWWGSTSAEPDYTSYTLGTTSSTVVTATRTANPAAGNTHTLPFQVVDWK